ncbi:MAG TPA: squalene/phytoene synthase family protein [Solirubrobacteraceae bacterium]|nr:squalene/phytoene synthase family protein [Solirubrobacteraceae bacterium]
MAPGLKLLPKHIRADAYGLHQVMCSLDDLVDENRPAAPERIDAVERWAQGEQADTPETRILTELARSYPRFPHAVLEGCKALRHDMAGAVIDTEFDLERYCEHAGGSILTMLAQMLGTSSDGEAKMATLGRAMQRTNILRDIDEDHAHGRLYIARTTIERFGPPLPGAREELLRDQIARADALYEEGISSIPLLSQGRRAIALCADLYREILRQIERDGYGRTPGQATVPRWRVRLLIAKHRVPFPRTTAR